MNQSRGGARTGSPAGDAAATQRNAAEPARQPEAGGKLMHGSRDRVPSETTAPSLPPDLGESGRFELLAESLPQLAWMANPDGWIFWYNRRWFEFTGTTLAEMEGWGWRKVHHPDHVERVVARVQHSWQTGEPWEDTFPLRRHDGVWRWFLSRALPARDPAGRLICWCGTNTDITEIRDAEERQKRLLDELNHRVKNTLAAVQSIAAQTVKNGEAAPDMRRKFDGRLLALSRAHDLLARHTWESAALGDLVRQTLSAYAAGHAQRIDIGGPDVILAPTAAVTLALALHELAENAAQYGALSQAGGRVAAHWQLDLTGGECPAVEIVWRESGGPTLAEPERSGFGLRLIERGLAAELSAEVRLAFPPDGLDCRIRLPLSAKVTAVP